MLRKLGFYAPGIPDKTHKPQPRPFTTPETWNMAIQKHVANKAGEHFDLRLVDPQTNEAHSWALRYLPTYPGDKTLAVHQPLHTGDYAKWEGTIDSGYGAGTVSLFKQDKIEVTKSAPGHILFNVYKTNGDTERFALIQTGGDQWLFHNVTPTRKTRLDIPNSKPSYKTIEPSDIDFANSNQVLAPKIDGAANVFLLRPNRPIETYSYRPSAKGASKLIDHTFRLPLHKVMSPSTLKPTVLMGEVFATDKAGHVQPVQTTTGVLLTNVWGSREKQKATPLSHVMYDVLKYNNKDVSKKPYAEKLKILQELNSQIPELKLPPMAFDAHQKARMIAEVTKGKNKLTSEGFVVYDLEQPVPFKSKFVKDFDVYFQGVHPGEGKYSKSLGRVSYSLTPRGPIIGRVGGGFSDEERNEIYANPNKYIGKIMKVEAQAQLPSKALRMPIFKEWRTVEKFPRDKAGDYIRSKLR